MRKVFFFSGVVGLVIAAAAAAACGSSDPDGGGINLPPRTDTGEQPDSAPGPTVTDSAAAPSCTSLTLKVGEPAACDKCAKDKCCAEVLGCTENPECAALQECLEPCPQTDYICIVTCQETHPDGNDALSKVGTCARSKCKTECPTDIPDADIFGDSGL